MRGPPTRDAAEHAAASYDPVSDADDGTDLMRLAGNLLDTFDKPMAEAGRASRRIVAYRATPNANGRTPKPVSTAHDYARVLDLLGQQEPRRRPMRKTRGNAYHSRVTPDAIHSFIQRLMRRELKEGELAALTTRDLGDINTYLAQYAAQHANLDASADPGAPSAGILTPVRPRPTPQPTLPHPKRTYSEQEILLEFGVLE